MIRAYHDPGLRYPVSRSGTWAKPVEFVIARGDQQTKTIYVYNNNSHPVHCSLLTPNVDKFAIRLPSGAQLFPGVTPIEMELAGTSKKLPYVEDFLIRFVEEGNEPPAGWSELDYSDWDAYLTTPYGQGLEAFRLEVSAHILPVGDERYGVEFPSHIRTPKAFGDYIASGMGAFTQDYRDVQVSFMADMLHEFSLWAVNKHYLHDPAFGPLRHARNRADLVGYKPPGLDQFPPKVRRRVLANSFKILRNLGTKEGYLLAFAALGVDVRGIAIEHNSLTHTWVIRVPRHVTNIFDLDYLGVYALYHTDAYSIIDLGLVESAESVEFSNLDFSALPTVGVGVPRHRITTFGATRTTPDGTTRVILGPVTLAPPADFAVTNESGGLLASWSVASDYLAQRFHIYRGVTQAGMTLWRVVNFQGGVTSYSTLDDSELALSGRELFYTIAAVDSLENEGVKAPAVSARFVAPGSGNMQASLPLPTLAATGDITPEPVAGTVTASLPLPTLAASGDFEQTQYLETFDDNELGLPPFGWTERFDTANSDWQVFDDASDPGRRSIAHNATAASQRLLTLDEVDGDPQRGDVDVLTVMRSSVHDGSSANRRAQNRIYIRAAGTEAAQDFASYHFELRGDDQIAVEKYVGTSGSPLQLAPFPWVAGDRIAVRFRAIGSDLKVRAWIPDDPRNPMNDEPSTWNIEVADFDYSDGWVGIGAWSNVGTRVFEFVALATGGRKATFGFTPAVGTLNASLPLPTLEAHGKATDDVVGSADLTLPLPTLDASGEVQPAAIGGDLDASLPLPTLLATGEAAATMPSGVIHDYLFDDATTLVDQIGTVNFPVTGATLETFGLRFDGVDDFAGVTGSGLFGGALNYDKDFSIAMVVRTHHDPSSVNYLFNHRDQDGASPPNLIISIRDTSDLLFGVRDSITNTVMDVYSTDVNTFNGRFALLVARWDAATQSADLFINDEGLPPVTAHDAFFSGGNGAGFAGTNSGSAPARMDGARATIFNRRLSDSEIINSLYPVMQAFIEGRGETLAQPKYQEDFSGSSSGSGTPTGWTERWNAQGNWDVAINASAVGGKEMTHNGPGAAAYQAVSFDAPDGDGVDRLNGEVLAMVRVDVQDASSDSFGVVLRGSGAVGSETGIICYLPATGGAVMMDLSSGVGTIIDSAPFAWAAGDRIMLRLRSYDDVAAAKFWIPADPANPLADEPAEWVLREFTTITGVGWLGAFAFENSNTRAWEWITVATDGGAAPMIGS